MEVFRGGHYAFSMFFCPSRNYISRDLCGIGDEVVPLDVPFDIRHNINEFLKKRMVKGAGCFDRRFDFASLPAPDRSAVR